MHVNSMITAHTHIDECVLLNGMTVPILLRANH